MLSLLLQPRCVVASLVLLLIGGCAQPASKTEKLKLPPAPPQAFIPYVPATQPNRTQAVQDLPTDPKDAQPAIALMYSVEIWEILLPRDGVSADEAFWKRVNEQAVDLPTYDTLFKNGMRVGELPIQELSTLHALVDERKGQRTQMVGIAGKFVEIPISSGIDRQTLFFFNRANELIGRTYERCDNVMYFSFEPTPRQPDRIRLALTPAVRGLQKRIQYSNIPGRLEKAYEFRNEEFHYDANLRLDLPLNSVLVIAPSVEARMASTLGGIFLIKPTPAQELERLLVIVPRAFKKNEPESAPAR